MNILHYTLGLPPYRSGGLTKYSVDLMKSQTSKGQQVFLLFPGGFSVSQKTKIKPSLDYEGIQVFEIINPLPVSLLGGVIKPVEFMNRTYSNGYKSFLLKIQPDIIHIHTLMGIHKEFFMAAKELNIKIIYTTHDYYGICPKVNLIDSNGEVCVDNESGNKCVTCNQNAYSLPLIYLMQTKTYRTIKDKKLVKNLRKIKNENINTLQNSDKTKQSEKVNLSLADNFISLRDYYFDIFRFIDLFHFNSETTKDEFKRYLDLKGAVLPISHNNILDNRKKKFYNVNSPLKISFLGPLDKYKGFPLLHESISKLLSHGQTNWELNVYGNNTELALEQRESDHITFHGRYQQDELENIFDNTDVLVVPSIWKETFGFIGLEALSFGVPVIVSEHVGCKDIIKHGETGIIFSPNPKELTKVLVKLINDRKILEKMNQNIVNNDFPHTLESHETVIKALYKKVIGVLT